MITPTVARNILFHPASNSTKGGFEPTAVCAAIIAKVNEDGTLNLCVFDGHGAPHAMENVPLVQEGEDAPEDGYYAEWMLESAEVKAGDDSEELRSRAD